MQVTLLSCNSNNKLGNESYKTYGFADWKLIESDVLVKKKKKKHRLSLSTEVLNQERHGYLCCHLADSFKNGRAISHLENKTAHSKSDTNETTHFFPLIFKFLLQMLYLKILLYKVHLQIKQI